MKKRRTITLRVRMFREELQALDEAASSQGMERSDYVRALPKREIAIRNAQSKSLLWAIARCERRLEIIGERFPADAPSQQKVLGEIQKAVAEMVDSQLTRNCAEPVDRNDARNGQQRCTKQEKRAHGN